MDDKGAAGALSAEHGLDDVVTDAIIAAGLTTVRRIAAFHGRRNETQMEEWRVKVGRGILPASDANFQQKSLQE